MYIEYAPTGAPSEQAPELAAYVDEQLAALVGAIEGLDRERLPILNAEPPKPRDGDLVYADGSNWDPGDGEGPYARVGGVWAWAVFSGALVDTHAEIQLDGAVQSGAAPTLDFDSGDFLLSESPADDFDISIKDTGIDHDQTTNYVADEHVAHTGVTLTAGNGLTGGGDISANRSFAVDDEWIEDLVNTLIQDGTGISWTYDDGLGTLTPAVSLSPFDTGDLSEGSNLYYTDERAQDAVGTILTNSSKVTFTYNDGVPSITASVIDGAIDHDGLLNTGGNAHIDWTGASDDLETSGSIKSAFGATEYAELRPGGAGLDPGIFFENGSGELSLQATGTNLELLASGLFDGQVRLKAAGSAGGIYFHTQGGVSYLDPNDDLYVVGDIYSGGTAVLTEVTISDIAAATLVIESEGISSNDNDNTVATCAAIVDYVGSQITTISEIQVDGVAQSTGAPTLDFDGSQFTLTESPTDDFDITIDESGVDHDALLNFVANEHIDWTAASDDFETSGHVLSETGATEYAELSPGNTEDPGLYLQNGSGEMNVVCTGTVLKLDTPLFDGWITLDAAGSFGGISFVHNAGTSYFDDAGDLRVVGDILSGGTRVAIGSGTTGGSGSAGAGNQHVELNINGTTYKLLHDGTV